MPNAVTEDTVFRFRAVMASNFADDDDDDQ